MAIADKWIEVMKLHNDFAWDMGNLVHTLTNRRWVKGGNRDRNRFVWANTQARCLGHGQPGAHAHQPPVGAGQGVYCP